MNTITVISNTRECFIELIHRDSDAGLWIVRRWRKSFWFKKRISSDWFNDERQAIVFACEMKLQYVGEPVDYFYKGKEIFRHGKN